MVNLASTWLKVNLKHLLSLKRFYPRSRISNLIITLWLFNFKMEPYIRGVIRNIGMQLINIWSRSGTRKLTLSHLAPDTP